MVNGLGKKSELDRNVLTLITGTAIAQAFPIASAPILTRIFAPEDFGIYSLYFAIVNILVVFGTARYELAIVLPKKNADAFQIVLLSCVISIMVAALALVIVLLFGGTIAAFFNAPKIESFLCWIPFSILITGIYQSLYYWFNRKKSYKEIAGSRIIQSSTMVISQISVGTLGFLTSFGLILGQFIGQLLSTLYLAKVFIKSTRGAYKGSIIKQYALAIRFRNFPKLFLPAHLIDATSRQILTVFLNIFFTATSAGFYMLVQRVVGGPLTIIGGAYGDVFRQQASNAFVDRGECKNEFLRTIKRLTLISAPPFIVFIFIAPDLFALIFGESWRVAGEYAQALTPMFLLQFIANPLSNMFIIAEKQKHELILQIIMVSTIFFIFSISESVDFAIIGYSVFYSFVYLYVIYICYIFSMGGNVCVKKVT